MIHWKSPKAWFYLVEKLIKFQLLLIISVPLGPIMISDYVKLLLKYSYSELLDILFLCF